MIEKLLKTFIDLDCYMFEYVPSIYPNKDGYMLYKKHGEAFFTASKGHIMKESDRKWEKVDNIQGFILRNLLSENTFNVHLLNALFTKRLGAKMDIEAIESVIDEPILRQMEADFAEFQQAFVNMVQKTLKKNTFKVISNED